MPRLDDDLRTLSREAFVYLYPLVLMETTRRQSVSLPAGIRPGYGPPNVFHHFRAFPPAQFRAVVRPNFDTLYSSAWFDLSDGPLAIHLPDTDDRYFMLPILDMWTEVFATIGKRATGTFSQDYVLVPPGFSGAAPAGHRIIESPTLRGWLIGRVQTNGPDDYPAVHAIQDAMSIRPLVPPQQPEVTTDRDIATEASALVRQMDPVEFFALASEALLKNAPHRTDFSLLARIASMGIIPGRLFDAAQFDDDELTAIRAGAADGLNSIVSGIATMGTMREGWTNFSDVIGVYGNDYLARARVAFAGLGANPPEEAIYPLLVGDEDGEPVIGSRDYVLHFPADDLPPAAAFWSITMYDGSGFPVGNELDRLALGDRDPLAYNADGSLDILIQHGRPADTRNWLPAPRGPLGVTMRLYAPRPSADGSRWSPPAVRRRRTLDDPRQP